MFTDAPASNNTVTISKFFSAAICSGVCPNLSVASKGMSMYRRVLSISIQADRKKMQIHDQLIISYRQKISYEFKLIMDVSENEKIVIR